MTETATATLRAKEIEKTMTEIRRAMKRLTKVCTTEEIENRDGLYGGVITLHDAQIKLMHVDGRLDY